MKPLSFSLLFRNSFLSFFFCAFLVTLCYAWGDPAVAFWVNDHNFKRFLLFEYCTYIANATVWVMVLYYLYFAISFICKEGVLSSTRMPFHYWSFLNVANSVAIAIFMKDAFKFVFGRYWIATWSNDNPSLLRDHAYGFHPFHSGVIYQSFPSGHTTIVVAAATAIWLTYPRGPWRWLALLAALAVVVGLLAENYHFLGDCIAGAWIGSTVAEYVTAYSRQLHPFRRTGKELGD